MKKNLQLRRRRRGGFTLIELVMVLVILFAVSALVVPIVDSIRRTSDKTNGTAGIKQVVDNISLYRSLKGSYPNDFDSLLKGDGTESALLSKGSKTVESALSANEAKSLTAIGIKRLQDLDDDNTSGDVYRNRPGNAGVLPRAVAEGGNVAVITDPDIVSSVYPIEVANTTATTPDPSIGTFDPATGIVTKANGTTIKLVALGIGPRCSAVGQTMQSPPAYTGVSNPEEVYNRFISVFAVYDNVDPNVGKKRAQLKGALDATFDFLNQEINEVEENTIE